MSSDPKVFGPGCWFSIHTAAFNAGNQGAKVAFVTLMKDLADKLPCIECRGHCKGYISKNPIESYWNTTDSKGRQIGLFLWTVNFHNAVNARLRKKVIPFDEAYQMYSDDKGCAMNCSAPDLETKTHEVGRGGSAVSNVKINHSIVPSRRI